MIAFPNCKINLGLLIKNKRSDGYHNIETVFYPLPFKDVLEVNISTDVFQFTSTGIDSGPPAKNLCAKAYRLLKKDFTQIPEIRMHLHKTIPPGAGLGGGSSDGAFTLRILNQKFSLGIPEANLYGYALRLGSDCPFFLFNKPCIGKGRGEILEEIPISLKGRFLKVTIPSIPISTAEIFKQVIPRNDSEILKEVISQPVENWKMTLKNDFEEIVFSLYPDIKKIKESMYDAGAVYSSLSGTGSAVYGIFSEKPQSDVACPKDHLEKWFEL